MITLGPLTVTLTEEEVRFATEIGSRRYRDVAAHRRTNRAALVGTDDEGANHALGALGEAAFAKWLGIPYSGTVNTFRSVKDVAGYEVRTRRGPRARLIIRPSDEGIYVLVTTVDVEGYAAGRTDRWAIRGWMTAEDARQHQWAQNPGDRAPCWMIPQDYLHPMSLLPKMEAVCGDPLGYNSGVVCSLYRGHTGDHSGTKKEAHDAQRLNGKLRDQGGEAVRREGSGEEQQRAEPDPAEFDWEG